MVQIRRAGPGDIAVLLELVREFYEIDRHRFDGDVVTRGLGPLLADDRVGQVWLILLDDRDDLDDLDAAPPSGYGVVTWGYSLESGGRDALLDELYVRQRGSGLGSEALQAMMAAAADAGASRMFLETEAHNERVRSFYARLGFRSEPSVWMSREFGDRPDRSAPMG